MFSIPKYLRMMLPGNTYGLAKETPVQNHPKPSTVSHNENGKSFFNNVMEKGRVIAKSLRERAKLISVFPVNYLKRANDDSLENNELPAKKIKKQPTPEASTSSISDNTEGQAMTSGKEVEGRTDTQNIPEKKEIRAIKRASSEPIECCSPEKKANRIPERTQEKPVAVVPATKQTLCTPDISLQETSSSSQAQAGISETKASDDVAPEPSRIDLQESREENDLSTTGNLIVDSMNIINNYGLSSAIPA
ncbi:hypothetical protein [Endozoicomonas sp. Mp262]|uniref:hypothetical protein n=1 Tax=Endozoicomonas sp. Mp262 TaxID=2919499 RepID=UPI0021DB63F6